MWATPRRRVALSIPGAPAAGVLRQIVVLQRHFLHRDHSASLSWPRNDRASRIPRDERDGETILLAREGRPNRRHPAPPLSGHDRSGWRGSVLRDAPGRDIEPRPVGEECARATRGVEIGE